MPVVGPEAEWSARAGREPSHADRENRIEGNEKTRASRPGFFMPCICRAGTRAVLLVLGVERYSPNSRYQSGTLSACFDPVLGNPSMPLDNVTSCESTKKALYHWLVLTIIRTHEPTIGRLVACLFLVGLGAALGTSSFFGLQCLRGI